MQARLWKYLIGFLLLLLVFVILAISQAPDRNLHIIACNVGQGDAILMVYGSTQILTDGGPDKSVMTCLGRHIPFWDRELELVISTHPDADHVTGLTEIIKSYKVDKLLINPIDPGTSIYEVLKNQVGSRGTSIINPTDSLRMRLGLIYLDIENPSEQFLNRLTVKKEGDALAKYSISEASNLYSIVYRFSFKNFSGIMLGDIPPEISDSLAVNWTTGSVDYIKIPHHGSVNGLTESLLKALEPKIAIISVGKNSWGLPKPEILNLLRKYNVKVYRTDEIGDIEIITDGEGYWGQ